jgi:hypothetical protein
MQVPLGIRACNTPESKVTFRWFRALIDTVLGRVPGKTGRDDTATRMARDADFCDRAEPSTQAREPLRKVGRILKERK